MHRSYTKQFKSNPQFTQNCFENKSKIYLKYLTYNIYLTHDKHLITIKYHYSWLMNIVTWILQLLPTAFTNLNCLDQNNPCWKTWNDRPSLVATIILLFKVLLFHQQLWIENLLKTRCKDIYKDPGRFSILLSFLTMKRYKWLPWNFGEYWGMQATGLWTRWQSVLQWGKKGMTLYFYQVI